MTRSVRSLVDPLLLALALVLPHAASAQALPADCPMPAREGAGAGPYDYRYNKGALPVVERRHFTTKVEVLISGESTSRPGPDIDYTLAKFPNHHRALAALTRLGQKLKTTRVPDMRYSIDCYFHRALALWPNDTLARLRFVQFLAGQGRTAEAGAQLDLAAHHGGDDPITHYNISVVALEIKDYTRALKHAHSAYALGWQRPELRDQLKKAGHWVEPSAPAASAPAASEPAVSAPAASEPAASAPPPA